jgi:hypothetical protein
LREVLPAGVAEQLMSGATVDAREFFELGNLKTGFKRCKI